MPCTRAVEQVPGTPISFRLNARDIPERDELYLTYIGSAIESGDEGAVGRGNRVTGLITPLRPMNVEGVAGKNPVYNVGKLYNIAAQRLAERLTDATGSYADVHLVSITGQRLDRPWRVLIRLACENYPVQEVRASLEQVLGEFAAITQELLGSESKLY